MTTPQAGQAHFSDQRHGLNVAVRNAWPRFGIDVVMLSGGDDDRAIAAELDAALAQARRIAPMLSSDDDRRLVDRYIDELYRALDAVRKPERTTMSV